MNKSVTPEYFIIQFAQQDETKLAMNHLNPNPVMFYIGISQHLCLGCIQEQPHHLECLTKTQAKYVPVAAAMFVRGNVFQSNIENILCNSIFHNTFRIEAIGKRGNCNCSLSLSRCSLASFWCTKLFKGDDDDDAFCFIERKRMPTIAAGAVDIGEI